MLLCVIIGQSVFQISLQQWGYYYYYYGINESLSYTLGWVWNLVWVNLAYCVEKKGTGIFRVGPKGVKTNSFGANPNIPVPFFCTQYAKFTHTWLQAFPRVQLRPSFFCSVLHHTPGCRAGRMYSYTSTPYTILLCSTLLSTETTYFTRTQYQSSILHLLITCWSLVPETVEWWW